MKMHKNIRGYACTLCNYTVSQKGKLSLHVKRVHEKIRDMKCQLCDYAAFSRIQVQQHTRIVHLDKIGMKKHSCLECNYVTISGNDLKRHKKCRHKDGEEGELKYVKKDLI